MSHFTVGVFIDKKGKKLEELLAPYQENNMGDCPKEYLKFNECDKSDLEKYEEHKEEYSNLEEFMEQYHGYVKDKEVGKYGYWENPNAKWDWYEIGGRWSNSLVTKDGKRCDYEELKNIDWNKMSEAKKLRAEKTWDSNPKGIEKYFAGIEKNDTRESFINRESEFSTYSVITQDGKWHSKGEMGWFGFSTDTQENREKWSKSFYDSFIKNSDEELIFVVVDCHI